MACASPARPSGRQARRGGKQPGSSRQEGGTPAAGPCTGGSILGRPYAWARGTGTPRGISSVARGVALSSLSNIDDSVNVCACCATKEEQMPARRCLQACPQSLQHGTRHTASTSHSARADCRGIVAGAGGSSRDGSRKQGGHLKGCTLSAGSILSMARCAAGHPQLNAPCCEHLVPGHWKPERGNNNKHGSPGQPRIVQVPTATPSRAILTSRPGCSTMSLRQASVRHHAL